MGQGHALQGHWGSMRGGIPLGGPATGAPGLTATSVRPQRIRDQTRVLPGEGAEVPAHPSSLMHRQVAPALPPPPASPPRGRRELGGALGRCFSRLRRDKSQPQPRKWRDHTQSGMPILLVHLSFWLPVPCSESRVRRWGHRRDWRWGQPWRGSRGFGDPGRCRHLSPSPTPCPLREEEDTLDTPALPMGSG